MLKKHIFKLTMPLCHFTGHNLWLLKPTRLNRGRGIHVVNNLSYLRQLIAQYCEGLGLEHPLNVNQSEIFGHFPNQLIKWDQKSLGEQRKVEKLQNESP